MEIRCRCSSCAIRFKVDAKYAGKKARCPKCQTVVDVPLQNLEESTTSLSSVNLGQPLASGTGTSSTVLPPQRANVPVAPLIAPGRAPAPAVNQQAAQPPMPQPRPAPQQPPQPQQTQPKSQPEPPQPQQKLPQAQPLSEPAVGQPASPSVQAGGPLSAAGVSSPLIQTSLHSPADPRPKRGTKKSSPVPLILAGGVAAAVFVAIGIFTVIATGRTGSEKTKQPGSAVAAGSGSATLQIDWPPADRRGGSLMIDGERKPISAVGQLKFVLSAGPHELVLQRRGFEQIETTISLDKGEAEHFAPQWQASALAPPSSASRTSNPSAVPVTPNPTGPRSPGNFPIGTAVSAYAPRGFDGWLQNFDAGVRQAAAAGKGTVVVVFGCSDAQPATQQLAQGLLQAGVRSRAACVVIDFPRTSEGYNLIEDTAQNRQLREDFGIARLPALALVDEAGKAFFLKEEWTDEFSRLGTHIDVWLQQRGERDALFEAARQGADDEARLAQAAGAVKWLQDNRIWRFYRLEIAGWLAMAERVDPDNEKAIQETFFEPQWLLNLVQVRKDDEGAILRVAAQLDPWAARGGFKDEDRGAKLHMTAAMLLAQVERFDDATRHLEHAIKYKPRDAKLAEVLASLKSSLENKDIVGSGTGFLVSPSGYVLTNHHVVEGDGAVEIRLPGSKETVPARVLAQDEERDMALLQVEFPEPEKFRPVPVVVTDIGRGSEVAAFGFPLGDTLGTGLKFTRGSISALPDASNEDMYLLDLRINPGNSGGPLCDNCGQVVGMITAKTGNFGFEDSYGMAIPAAALLEFLSQHLPAGTPIAGADPAAVPLSWDQVDKRVSSGVLMIVKKK